MIRNMPDASSDPIHVPFLRPDIRDADIDRMNRSIRSGWLAHGSETAAFESALKGYLGVKDAVMVASCTAALHLSLIAAGVGEGDEVITTPLSWVSTSNVILYQRAVPVFADVEPATGLLDPAEVAKKITSKTKAIIVVHIYGQMADMRSLRSMADRHGIALIEDTAHALEAKRDGVRPAELGFSACLSFHVAKNITAGQGGAVVTNDEEAGRRMRLLRRDGVMNQPDGKRVMLDFGYKYDATDYQAALLRGQLERIDETHAMRRRVFDAYATAFAASGVRFASFPSSEGHAAHMFVIFVDPARRDGIRGALASRGVETSIHYAPIHLEPYYRQRFGFVDGDFPIAEALGASIITLPTYALLAEREQQHVIDAVVHAVRA